MLQLSVPWWELVVRAALVYFFLLIALRLTGKRQVGQLEPFDLVLLLILSEAVQNAINAGDDSMIGGLIGGTTLIGLNYVMGTLTDRSRRLEKLVDGRPILLIHNGTVDPVALERAQMTHNELNAQLRQEGCASVAEVHFAMLETNGRVSVIKKKS